eukprot:3580357-Amphidinium_carterae.2
MVSTPHTLAPSFCVHCLGFCIADAVILPPHSNLGMFWQSLCLRTGLGTDVLARVVPKNTTKSGTSKPPQRTGGGSLSMNFLKITVSRATA